MRVPHSTNLTRLSQFTYCRIFSTLNGLTATAAVAATACLVVAAFFVGPVAGQSSNPAVTIANASAAEGDGITFTVTLDRAVSGGLTVTPGFAGGTAVKGTDYTANTSALTFAGTAGENKTFSVTTTEDAVVEHDETFTVSLSVSGTTQTVTATDTAEGTITNDDNATVTVAAVSGTEGGSGYSYTVNGNLYTEVAASATLNRAVQGGFRLYLRASAGTATIDPDGNNFSTTDFGANLVSLNFTGNAGEKRSLDRNWVAIHQDEVVEGAETFNIAYSIGPLPGDGPVLPQVPSGLTASGPATGTINDDDTATVTIADASASEGDAIEFTVAVDKAVASGFSVTPGFAGGTATKSTDYTENTAAISFTGTAGETQTLTVATTEDQDIESDETFTVSLSVSGARGTVQATDTAEGTITNDDFPAVTIADASAEEGDGITFTVTLDRAVSGGLTVTPGFAGGTAVKGTDYTANTSALTFAGTAGENKTFSVTTTEDAVVEHDETFTVSLSVSGTTQTVTATDTAEGTITNDDNATVTVAAVSGTEGGSGYSYTVNGNLYTEVAASATLNRAVQGGFRLYLRASAGTATIDPDGNNFSTTDFGANLVSLNFTGNAGEKRSLDRNWVAIHQDEVVEGAETFNIAYSIGPLPGDGPVLPQVPSGLTASGPATGTINDDDTATVTIADASASEGDGIEFTVSVDKAVASGFSVTPSFSGGTAVKGTDYTANTSAVSFTGTASETQTFTVSTTEDTDIESDETFTVSLSVSGAQGTVSASDTAEGTITNDDFPAVTIADASAEEGDGITFTVTLDRAVSGGLTVTPGFAGGTAVKGTDYTANTSALTFAGTAGENKTFSVTTTEDAVVEHDETFTVSLSVSGTTQTVTATDTAEGTITNDDNATVTVAAVSGTEGGSGYSYTVNGNLYTEVAASATLNRAVQGGFRLYLRASAGTATIDPDGNNFSTTDFGANLVSLNFTGNAGEKRSLDRNWVAIHQDEVVEGAETFNIAYSIGPLPGDGPVLPQVPSGLTASGPATGTINDDDTATVTIADASASEGDGIEFTVSVDKAVASGFSVTPSFSGGTAVKGTDYTANTSAVSFTGTASETQTFTVSTTEDTDIESDETFTVSLSVSGAQGTVSASDTAEGTITNDDFPAVTIADASAEEGDGITFTVTLDRAVSGGLTVTPGFAGGTAVKGTDYTANTSALTFAGTAGENKTFSVTTTEDAVVEHDETFTVSLSVSGTTQTVTATDTAEGTITNDDNATVTVAAVSGTEGGSGYSYTVNGNLYTEVAASATLNRAVQGGFRLYLRASAGTATIDPDGNNFSTTDFGANLVSLNFTGNAGEKRSLDRNWVAIHQDEVVEGAETFNIAYSIGPLPGDGPLPPVPSALSASGPATGTINDDDTAIVTIADTSAAEGDEIEFTLEVDNAVASGFSVTPSYAGGTATKGTDYTANTSAVSFTGTAGETQTFTVSTTEDTDIESDETFTVSLSVSGARGTVQATDTAEGTITNDDYPAVTIADTSAEEGNAITFTVTLDHAVSGGFTVTPSFTDGTATKGTDYTANTSALTFAGTAGENKTFIVATTDDDDDEPNETFTVSLTVSGTTETVTATDTATGTINNDDAPALTIADVSAEEGNGITFTVTLDQAVSGGFTVSPSFTDVTATKGTDYTENTAALSFTGSADESKTFTVATTEDAAVEVDETFTVSLTVSGTTETVTATDTATGTITNDDFPILTIADASAEEGDGITFTVTLDHAVSGGLTVTPSFTDGTATKGTDYTENTNALSFSGTAEESRSFTVATAEDDVVEADVSFTVGLTVSGTTETVTATDTATGTISNDDTAILTIADASASEGDEISFTVAADKAVTGGFSVTPGFDGGTATKGTDYTENTAALSFAGTAGETHSFNVSTTEDEDDEANETFTVSLSVSGTTLPVTATNTATGTVIDDEGVPTVSISGPTDVQKGPFDATITFSEDVTGFERPEISVGNGAVTAFSGSGSSYTASITPAASGTVTADVAANVAVDSDDKGNAAASQFSVQADLDAPTVSISGPATTQNGPFVTTITFSEPVTGFEQGDVTAGNGSVTGFSGSSDTYTATITPAATGTVTADVAANAAIDVAGNGNEAASQFSVLANVNRRNPQGNNGGGTVYVSVHEPEDPVEEGLIVELPVRITESVGGTVEVPWSSSSSTSASKLSVAESGTKHEHKPSSGTVTLAAGQTETMIEITILDDDEHEDLESFQVELGEPSVAREVTRKVSVSQRTATVTILDNDAPPVFDEGDTAIRFVVENTPPHTDIGGPFLATDAEDDPLSYSLGGSDAPAFALDPATGQLRTREPLDFETRNSYGDLTVTVDDGHGHTGILHVTVNVTDASPPNAPGTPSVARSASDPRVSLVVSWNPPADNGAPVTDYDVRYREAGTTEWRDHAFDGAGAGTTLTGLKAASTYEVQVLARNVEGAGEWSDSGRASTLGPSAPGETVTVTVSSASAVEGEVLTFTIKLNRAVSGGLTVTPGFRDGTAVEGVDYTANAAPIRFTGTVGEKHTFTVAATDDEVVENDETFTVSLGISGTSTSGVTTDTATGTLRDNDGGTVRGKLTVTIGDAEASEGDGVTFKITLKRPVQGGLTLTPVFSDGTATSGIDYTANTAPLTFVGTAGETHTFTAETKEDEAVEENETFTVSLRVSDAPSGVTVGNPVTGTIIDDDGGTVGGSPTVASGDANASEGDGMTFKVTLNRPVQGGLTLTPVFSDGTATAGVDYTANVSPLRFSGTAGEAHTFTVETKEDDAIEGNETFTVSLRVSRAPSGVTVGDPVTGTIIDDGHNEPPGFDAGAATTRAVAENTPAGGTVGEPVAATDPNGDVLSYTLSGSDAFAIDSDTGQISVSKGASLDYEAGPLSYVVTVTVNDGREGSSVIEVTINVTDAAEPPAAPSAPRVTGASLESLRLDWRPPANTGPAISDYDVQYRKQGAADWTSHPFTGTKTMAAIRGLESGADYEVQVRAKNAEGAGAWSASGTGRTRVNTAPVAVDDVVTVFRGRRATSLWNGDTRDVTRNPSATPPEDFDIPEPEAGAKIAPLANSVSATETDDGHISVLANDVDAEDDWSTLTAILVEAPNYGSLTLFENGTFIYIHDGSRVAEDRFTYRVEDSRGARSDEATVRILITGVNLGPSVTGTIPDQVLTMGTNGRVDLTGLFTDPDGDPLTYEASSDNGIVNVSLADRVIALSPVAVSTARVTVTARDPSGLSATLSFAVIVENLQSNRARVLELSLAAFGRTVLSQAVDAITGHFEATSRALRATIDGSRLVLGQAFNAMEWAHVAARMFGIPLDVPASSSATGTAAQAGLSAITSDPDAVQPTLRAPSGRSILTRSSFQIAMDRPGTGWSGWTLWGRGTGSRYTGDSGSNNRMGGGVTAAYVGADYRWGNRFALGVAASYSDGTQDFDNAGASTGEWHTRLTSLRPYLHWSPTGKLGLWGMLGFGRGDAELNSGYGGPLAGTGSSTIVTDISSRSAALGGRMDLMRVRKVDLALTADAFAVSTSSEALAGLRATAGDARRVRMMVNGSTGWSVTPDTRMDLSLALGARLDGGDVDTGLGAELAGALSIANRRIGLDVEIRSRWLAAHQDRDFRERGLSLALGLDPGSDNRGLTLSLSPAWGENAGSGVEALWKGERTMAYRSAAGGREALDWRPGRTRAALGYGLRTQKGRGGMEPFVELDVNDMGLHRLGGGLRLNVVEGPDRSPGFLARNLRLELLGEYRLSGRSAANGESVTRGRGGDYRFGLSLFRDF